MARSLMVTPESVFQNTLISGDLDQDKLVPHIEAAQDIDLFNLLGQNLYERIDNLIADGEIRDAGNENYLDLVQRYITPYLQQYAAARFLQYARYTVSEKGVFIHSATNATQASQDDIDRLVRDIIERGERYGQNMWDHICSNSSRYPEYNTSNAEQTPPSSEPFDFFFTSF